MSGFAVFVARRCRVGAEASAPAAGMARLVAAAPLALLLPLGAASLAACGDSSGSVPMPNTQTLPNMMSQTPAVSTGDGMGSIPPASSDPSVTPDAATTGGEPTAIPSIPLAPEG